MLRRRSIARAVVAPRGLSRARAGADIATLGTWGPYGDNEGDAVRAAVEQIKALVPGVTDNQIDIIAAIGWFESGFGLTPTWRLPSGLPSYNWGGVRARPEDDKIPHGDKDAQGADIRPYFAAFTSMVAGLQRFLTVWGDEAFKAAADGDATRVAAIMYRRGYFSNTSGSNEERILGYARMIDGRAHKVATYAGRASKVFVGPVPADWRLGAKPGAVFPGDSKLTPTMAAAGVGIFLGLALVGLGVWWFFFRKVGGGHHAHALPAPAAPAAEAAAAAS